MSPEFLEALKMVEEYDRLRPQQTTEYRLYYNDVGEVIMYCEVDHPNSGNYIVIDHPDIFFKNNTTLLRVIDGKLKILKPQSTNYSRLQKSSQGQAVVKGIASLPLTEHETYHSIEYYERKTNN
jgi:hypothetical protein